MLQRATHDATARGRIEQHELATDETIPACERLQNPFSVIRRESFRDRKRARACFFLKNSSRTTSQFSVTLSVEPMLRSSLALTILAACVACSSSTESKARKTDSASEVQRVPFDASAAARVATVIASCTTHINMPTEHQLVDMYSIFYPLGSPHETSALIRCIDDEQRRRTGCRALDDCLALTVVPSQGNPTQCVGNVAQAISASPRVAASTARASAEHAPSSVRLQNA